ncbi:hypothetical protein HYH02_010118 [Chlamydomonas schloesseri]|uniref:MPN domain-containing protein n=1 Tax=Chlamydomonas schloesseri TaxID=2026947 RepID=A0A835T9H1_9CHLO|nr:hypothetical protein HYH02_010118 [Chlamydomonas schloesseri]|eukprot:KAG2441279.1 hypothetical protein HYH02_010118 [Chlamydomonas schloesseri]
MSFGGQTYQFADFLEFAVAPGALPSEITVRKVFKVSKPLRVKLSGSFDINTQEFRTKASVKERIFGGSIRFIPEEGAVEYRKRLSVFGLVSAQVWSRWDLLGPDANSPNSHHNGSGGGFFSRLTRPRVGCGLALGDVPPGCALLSAARLPALLVRPLSYSFKSSLPLSSVLRVKAYCDVTVRLPRRLSLWVDAHGAGGEAFGDEEEEEGQQAGVGVPGGSRAGGGGGGGAGLLVRLRRTALQTGARMSLERVEVTNEVLLAVLAHAHSTESEEVMGLLLGDITEPVRGGGAVCRISLAFPQIRTDRRKDRVETSPEQMARCSAHAERLTRETGSRVRVVGWYHSHPHITVLPSHVDVRTQAMYQLLDPGFVGLIVSAFNRDAATEASTVQLTAFQALPDVDPQAAGGLIRKEVRLALCAAASQLERSFSDLMVVQRMLLMEENEVYKKALASALAASSRSSAVGSGAFPTPELVELHHAGVYQAHMARLVQTALHPSLAALGALVAQQRAQAAQLGAEVAALEAQVAAQVATGAGGRL